MGSRVLPGACSWVWGRPRIAGGGVYYASIHGGKTLEQFLNLFDALPADVALVDARRECYGARTWLREHTLCSLSW